MTWQAPSGKADAPADRTCKRPFGDAPAGAPPANGLLHPSVPRQLAGAARSYAVCGAAPFGWCWIGVSGFCVHGQNSCGL
jgi:hypothetical protein